MHSRWLAIRQPPRLDCRDANAELEEINPGHRDESKVLALKVRIYSALEKWELMQAVAKVLAQREPDNVQWTVSWACATRRTDSIEAARLILLEAVERIPTVAILHYNLACYECLLGDVEVAKARLQHAFKLEPRYRLKALEDEDLEPLWDSLKGWRRYFWENHGHRLVGGPFGAVAHFARPHACRKLRARGCEVYQHLREALYYFCSTWTVFCSR